MLQGRFEWTIGLVATVVVVVIVAWYSVLWNRDAVSRVSSPSPATTDRPVTTPPGRDVPTATAPTASERPVVPEAAPPVRVRPGLSVSTYRVTASRGPSWLQVRDGSYEGSVLFDGTLEQGASARFRSRRLWIRFGSASNLDLRIDGERSRLPLFGTYDAVVTPSGARADPTVYVTPGQATAAQSP